MKSLKKIVTAVIVGSCLAATMGSAAQAGDWQGRRGYHPGYGGPAPRYHAPQPRYGYGHEQRRDRSGDKIAKGVAIGVGALILGTILANEARRHRDYEGY